MTALPRSRALVLLDGPGHIMPVEPVTPPGSTVWRVVHFPLILLVVAVGLLGLAGYATGAVAVGLRQIGRVPGGRYIAPAAAAAISMAIYWLFVRFVERRRSFEELGTYRWWHEGALGFVGGLLLPVGVLALLVVLDAIHVFGFNTAGVLLLPLVVSLCASVIQELVLRGLFFRLFERLTGSWIALLVSGLLFGIAEPLAGGGSVLAGAALALAGGLVPAALYMVTRRLWAAIGLHAAWNLAAGGLFGAPLPPKLVLSIATGPDWLTGGARGPDASLPSVAAEALLLAVLLVVAVRRGHIVRPTWSRGRHRG